MADRGERGDYRKARIAGGLLLIVVAAVIVVAGEVADREVSPVVLAIVLVSALALFGVDVPDFLRRGGE